MNDTPLFTTDGYDEDEDMALDQDRTFDRDSIGSDELSVDEVMDADDEVNSAEDSIEAFTPVDVQANSTEPKAYSSKDRVTTGVDSTLSGNTKPNRSSLGKKRASAGPEVAPKKRLRKAPASIGSSRPIARSVDECDAWDKMLVTWRDAGKTWEAIRAEWERLTGEKAGLSTIPNRYKRLKDNFSTIDEEYHQDLILIKRRIEADFERRKWEIISNELRQKTKQPKISSDTLKRQYKKLMVKAGVRGPTEEQREHGVEDPDFDIDITEDEVE